jgi:pyrroline-5-carboxylate reductase
MSLNSFSPASTLLNRHLTFIGGGNMARAIIGGLLKQGLLTKNITVVEPHSVTRQRLIHDFAIDVLEHPDETIAQSNVLIMAVKPQVFPEVAKNLTPYFANLTPENTPLVFSIAAGIRLMDMQRWFGHTRLVRAMPNTPALIGQGVTGLVAHDSLNASERALIDAIAQAIGDTEWVENESLIDSITAVSGSGPAYVFYILEAMQAAAVTLGLDAEAGRRLAIQTFAGATELARRSPEALSTLREQVTSKGGTTYAALTVLQERGVHEAFQAALAAAAARGKELGEQLGQK